MCNLKMRVSVVTMFILLHKKFLQFDWLRAVVLQFYFEINVYMFSVIFQNCPKIVTYNNFEISLAVFMPYTSTNHAITYTNMSELNLYVHFMGSCFSTCL